MSRLNLDDPRIDRPYITNMRLGITAVANANLAADADMGPVIFMTPSAARTITLPAVTKDMRGLTLYFVTGAAFALTVNNAASALVATVPATVGATSMVVCLGDATLGVGGWTGGM